MGSRQMPSTESCFSPLGIPGPSPRPSLVICQYSRGMRVTSGALW